MSGSVAQDGPKHPADEPLLRLATLADADAVADCVHSAYIGYVDSIGQKPGPLLDDYQQVLRNNRVWIYEETGKGGQSVVGLVVLSLDDHRALLANVAIRPGHQGRGWGRRLIGLAEDEASRRGYQAIELYTHEKMERNQALYRRMGYEEFDRRLENGLPRVYMRKVLAAQASSPRHD